ncbi:hypothetical protein JDV02_003065 [Purpureocillium takamizusanense]|uniref:Uncharacterized protein n=1 Tax=Purpureocillium takamizusanense TaxID=2060973 RepID=A0A9Q8QAS5_9HYPO|nr:uncharacterized protein JDV02_003065 [Purpureocillium takamizusanense]UNI16643.1 hypothetical protein JDV02_003065 [Purpureocillium takamizusanense]
MAAMLGRKPLSISTDGHKAQPPVAAAMTTPPPSPPQRLNMAESSTPAGPSRQRERSPPKGTSPVRTDSVTKGRSQGCAPSPTEENKPRHYRDRRPSMATCEALLRPRPYEEIAAEIAYLSASLEVHSSNTRALIRRYAQAEDELRPLEHVWCKQRRRLRKQLNLLRVQINGAATQEQAVFIRLSELYMEAQSRETRAQRSQQSKISSSDRSCGGSSIDGRTNPTTSSTSLNTRSRPGTPLNAEALEFVPQVKGTDPRESDESIIDADPHLADALKATTEDSPKAPIIACGAGDDDTDPHAMSGGDADFECNHGLKYEFAVTPDDDGELRPVPRRMPSAHEDVEKMLERRPSLPNMSSLWPG